MPSDILIIPNRSSTSTAPVIQFSGSAANNIRLEVLASGSVVFLGNSGSLFSVIDILTGSLFAVNDISGLPILEVFSDDRVVMGRFASNTLVVTGSNVSIGKATPNARLDISGSTAITGSASITVSLGVGVVASGTTGEIRATDNIIAYYTSDARLKTNIEKIDDALNKVCQMQGVIYDWTDDFKNSRGGEDGYFIRDKNPGIIAQEVEKAFPNVVGERPDGYKAVRYELLVPLLIEAIKEQQIQINELKARIK